MTLRPRERIWTSLVFVIAASLTVPSQLRDQEGLVEPLQVGRHRQLFIDNHVIDSVEGLDRILHHPERYPDNPVLSGTEPWEKWLIEVNGRPVLYDEQSHEFKMWYGGYLVDGSAPNRLRFKVHYATSKDGIRWNRPILRMGEWQGSWRNNILPWGENWMRRPNVIKDVHDPDSERRYKMTYVDVIGKKTAVVKAHSADGIHWHLNGDGRPWFREQHNLNLLGWDPFIRRYVLFIRMPGVPNSIGRSTSEDFVSWSEPKTVLAPSTAEGNVDFKGLAAFSYENLYLGWLWIFYGNRNSEAELVLSRDGRTWGRVFPARFFLKRGESGSWDHVRVLPVAPVVYGEKIWIYYTGGNFPDHSLGSLSKVQAGWVENGERMQEAIGLATLRLDGFVSLRPGNLPGHLTTRVLKLTAGSLMVNAAVAGELRVAVLDKRGEPITGYGNADCVPIQSDGIRQRVQWRRHGNLDALVGQEVKLRFSLRRGDLFSFWFEGR